MTDYGQLDEAMEILTNMDKLLESHPNWRLQKWIDLARDFGERPEEKDYYESDARRIITTWGGWVDDYAARTWSGLIRDYYIPRWKLYYRARRDSVPFDLEEWEENWIHSGVVSEAEPFQDPVETAYSIVAGMESNAGNK